MKIKPIPEEWARTIDCCTKLVTMLAIVLGGGWTVYQYFHTRTDQLRVERLEATKPILEKRLQLYSEATTAAAIIATSTDGDEVVRAKAKFRSLYLGPMALVEDYGVWESMGEFARCMDQPDCKSLPDLSTRLAGRCSGSLRGDLPPAPASDLGIAIR